MAVEAARGEQGRVEEALSLEQQRVEHGAHGQALVPMLVHKQLVLRIALVRAQVLLQALQTLVVGAPHFAQVDNHVCAVAKVVLRLTAVGGLGLRPDQSAVFDWR